jgi:O-antigen/teichoic acid export membrane protein
MKKDTSLLKNSLLSITMQVTIMIFGLIMPKILLEQFGSQMNGLVASINQVCGYLTLLESGLGIAATQALFKPVAEHDWNKINPLLSATQKDYTKIGNAFLLLLSLFAITYPFIVLNQVPYIISFSLVIILSMTTLIEYYSYSTYRIFLNTNKKQYIIVFFQLIFLISSKLLQIFFALNSINILIIYLIPAIAAVLRILCIRIYIKKQHNQINLRVKPDFKQLNKRKSAFIHQIAGLVVNSTDVFILTLFSNLKVVSIYTIYNLVFSAVNQVISVTIIDSIFPYLGSNLVENQNGENKIFFRCFELIYVLLITVLFSITAVLILPFIKVYTIKADINYVDTNIALLFLFVNYLHNIRMPGVMLINAKGHFKETQGRAIIEASINLIVSLLCVHKYGITGVLFGTICSFGYRTLDIILYSNHVILNSRAWYTIKNALVSILFILATYIITIKYIDIGNTWISVFKLAISSTLIIVVIAFPLFTMFNIKETKILLRHIKGVLK